MQTYPLNEGEGSSIDVHLAEPEISNWMEGVEIVHKDHRSRQGPCGHLRGLEQEEKPGWCGMLGA